MVIIIEYSYKLNVSYSIYFVPFSAQVVIHHIPAVGPTPTLVVCPSCRQSVQTRLEYEPTTRTHLFALGLCLLQYVFSLPIYSFEFYFNCKFFPGAICVAVFHIAWIHVKMETITVQTVEHSLELMHLKYSIFVNIKKKLGIPNANQRFCTIRSHNILLLVSFIVSKFIKITIFFFDY